MLFKRLSRRRGKDAAQQTQFIIPFESLEVSQLAPFEPFEAFFVESFEQPFELQLGQSFLFFFSKQGAYQSQPAYGLEYGRSWSDYELQHADA